MFDNSIFPFLSAATSLRTLYLESNYMEGVFPPQGLANMRNLKVLNLKDNSFIFLCGQDVASSNTKRNYWRLLYSKGKAPSKQRSMSYYSYLSNFQMVRDGVGFDAWEAVKMQGLESREEDNGWIVMRSPRCKSAH
ncbi:unnamed protein product [Brassica rapa]|uniref:Uncharacterized protein n=1 Tax=Brassica campestris TaxID=3711 RepID=A0A8D9DNN4_BRACM|nr:unnamed protein product [Brassica rapa]